MATELVRRNELHSHSEGSKHLTQTVIRFRRAERGSRILGYPVWIVDYMVML